MNEKSKSHIISTQIKSYSTTFNGVDKNHQLFCKTMCWKEKPHAQEDVEVGLIRQTTQSCFLFL